MKKLILLMLAMPLVVLGTNVDQVKVREALSIRQPLITDSLNSKGDSFEAANILDNYVAKELSRYASFLAEVDTAGYITLPKPAEGMSLYLLETTIRPERYAKGKLKVESASIYEVMVDGASKAKKTEAQDSVTSSSTKKVNLEMVPESEHVVLIKMIADAGAPESKIKIEYVPDDEFEDVAVAIGVDGKRRFEMRDIAIGSRVTATSISPDGKYMVVKYNDRFSKDKSRSYAHLIDLRTGKIIRNNINTSLRWMPKGSTLYYTVNAAEGYDVKAVDVPSMDERFIMYGIPKSNFEWSPTEDFIIYYVEEDNAPEQSPIRRYLDPDDRIPGNRDRQIAYVYYPATGLSQQLTYGKRQSTINDISPDGKRLLIQVADYDAKEWPFYFSNLYELELSTMKADTILTHDTSFNGATYSPDGKSLFIVADPLAFESIGLNAGNHPIPNTSDLQGFIMDLATRQVRAMTRDFNPSLTGDVNWNAADGQIYFMAENGFNNTVYQLNPKTGDIKQIPQEVTYVQRFSIGNDESRWLSYYGQSWNSSGQAYLVDMKSGKQTLIDDPWHEVADKIEWGNMEQWNFTASDGTEIEGFITYPPEFDPSKKYPMIVYYYGGTSPTKHNTYSQYNAQLFASRGYVVYQLNPSGTTGYGQEFSSRHVNAWGDYTANDIIEGVTKICDEHDFIDREKVGCIGASYGGFMTEYLQTLTDIFAAAVSHAGISNVTSYWGEGYWGYSYNALAASKSYPWDNPDLYTKHGALFNADKIHTPLLMTHGSADTNVPVGESIQLYNALKILGREVELITVADEDHYISGYDNRIQWQNSVMAWFAKWLQDDPRWWDALFPEQVD